MSRQSTVDSVHFQETICCNCSYCIIIIWPNEIRQFMMPVHRISLSLFGCMCDIVIYCHLLSLFYNENIYGIHAGLECINETFTFAEESSWFLVHKTLN